MEYAIFGEGIVQREDVDHPWVPVPEAEVPAAAAKLATEAAVRAAERYTSEGFGIRITRAPENEAIAASLGLTADELAERLATEGDVGGTLTRLPEKEFDAAMAQLGLDPKEARARFAGTHRN